MVKQAIQTGGQQELDNWRGHPAGQPAYCQFSAAQIKWPKSPISYLISAIRLLALNFAAAAAAGEAPSVS